MGDVTPNLRESNERIYYVIRGVMHICEMSYDLGSMFQFSVDAFRYHVCRLDPFLRMFLGHYAIISMQRSDK